jgi:hypothetical protein
MTKECLVALLRLALE